MATKILLYGKSVFIAGIVSILADNPNLDLQHSNVSNLDDLPAADIILADLSEAKTLRALPQLSAKLGSTLVGIDPATGATTILSGTSHTLNSMQELMTFLQSAVLQSTPKGNTVNAANLKAAPILKTQKEVPRGL
jgi:hypothetical protein